jgi:hypothetical protein
MPAGLQEALLLLQPLLQHLPLPHRLAQQALLDTVHCLAEQLLVQLLQLVAAAYTISTHFPALTARGLKAPHLPDLGRQPQHPMCLSAPPWYVA